MNKAKRIIALAFASLMLCINVADASEIETFKKEEAVAQKKVEATGIMTGTEKGFEGNKTLTRAEAAAILTRLKGVSKESADALKNKEVFTDVKAGSWAAGYINKANELGLVKGVSSDKFSPNELVSMTQLKTMVIRALGAGEYVESEGKWPDNYLSFADEKFIGTNIPRESYLYSTRAEASVIISDVLEQDMWENNRPVQGKTILKDTFKIDNRSIRVNSINGMKREITYNDVTDNTDELKTVKLSYDVDTNITKVNENCSAWFKIKDGVEELLLANDMTYSAEGSIFFDEFKFNPENEPALLSVNQDGTKKSYILGEDTAIFVDGFSKSYVMDTLDNVKKYHGYLNLKDEKVDVINLFYYDESREVKDIKVDNQNIILTLDGADEQVTLKRNKDSINIKKGDKLYVDFGKYGTNQKEMIVRTESSDKGVVVTLLGVTDVNVIDSNTSSMEEKIIKPSDIHSDLKTNGSPTDELRDFLLNTQTIDHAKVVKTASNYSDIEAGVYITYEPIDGYKFKDSKNYVFQEIMGTKPDVKVMQTGIMTVKYYISLK